jgi:MinD-like ATPase involved in chromosome partitioning or flagellar assembly
MGIVVLGSVRSCGTTTAAAALAATWPAGRRVLVVELDPAGGTLAAASGWAAEPSLVTLAAAARRASDPEAIWAHCHQLPGGAAVLAAPASASQVRSSAGMLGALLGRLGELDADVLVDAGRTDPGRTDPAMALPGVVAGAGRVVLTARPRLADLQSLATFVETCANLDSPLRAALALVLVGDGPYPDIEVTEALGIEVLGRIPWDPQAAELLTATAASDRQLRLSPLVRAARSIAENLAADAAPVPVPDGGLDQTPEAAGATPSRLLRRLRAPAAVATVGASAGFGAAWDGVSTNGSSPGGEVAR